MASALDYLDTERRPSLIHGEEATATFSRCRTYRYLLTRRWTAEQPAAAFVMLNPSTADAFAEDPTIRRCISFARSWGAGGVLVLNLFALRATDPRALRHHPDPVGPDNDLVIAAALSADRLGPVVCAWGIYGLLNGRAERITALVRDLLGVPPLCLGATKDGHPRHPLYVRGDTAASEYGAVSDG